MQWAKIKKLRKAKTEGTNAVTPTSIATYITLPAGQKKNNCASKCLGIGKKKHSCTCNPYPTQNSRSEHI